MKARILFALVIAVLFGVYIGLLVGRAVFSPEVVLRDDGGVIRLKREQTFTISLETNPSTGYSWEIGEFDGEVVELVGREVIRPPEVYPSRFGAPSRLILRFKAVGQGQTELKLEHRRSWEEDVKPARVFRVEVTVR